MLRCKFFLMSHDILDASIPVGCFVSFTCMQTCKVYQSNTTLFYVFFFCWTSLCQTVKPSPLSVLNHALVSDWPLASPHVDNAVIRGQSSDWNKLLIRACDISNERRHDEFIDVATHVTHLSICQTAVSFHWRCIYLFINNDVCTVNLTLKIY